MGGVGRVLGDRYGELVMSHSLNFILHTAAVANSSAAEQRSAAPWKTSVSTFSIFHNESSKGGREFHLRGGGQRSPAPLWLPDYRLDSNRWSPVLEMTGARVMEMKECIMGRLEVGKRL